MVQSKVEERFVQISEQATADDVSFQTLLIICIVLVLAFAAFEAFGWLVIFSLYEKFSKLLEKNDDPIALAAYPTLQDVATLDDRKMQFTYN